METNKKLTKLKWLHIGGIRVVVGAFGLLCGLTGVIAGWFELQQGDIPVDGLVISTIGPNYVMVDDFTYQAITIIPNMQITGLFAICVSIIFMIWSVGFVHKKNGAWILLGLAIMQMLVGGGWVIDLALISCILATRIDKPLNWWRNNLPEALQYWLTKLFPVSIGLYTLIAISMLVLTIFGVNDVTTIQPMEILAIIMFFPMLLMILGAITYDLQFNNASQNDYS